MIHFSATLKLAFRWALHFIFLTLPLTISAQREADNWFFGRGVGLSFATGSPKPVYGSLINQTEGTAVASDPRTGKLLFYTDGTTAWNSDHRVMENGEGLLGSFTSVQSALILPVPARSGLFYLFTTRSFADRSGGLHYSIVDMNLDHGKGDIRSDKKNIRLEEFGSEKLTAVPHRNKRDFWLLSHRWDCDIFLVYLISPQGISEVIEIKIGPTHRKVAPGSNHFIGEELGTLKASPDGKMLAAAVFGENRPFELYDFDDQNGIIFNYRSLGNFSEQYSLSFSPDNSKLYLSLHSDYGCFQFDLKKPGIAPLPITSPDTIQNNPTYVGGSMQLGPDGKLYIAAIDRKGLLFIDSPNLSIHDTKIEELQFDLKGGRIYQGLPNFLQSTFNTSAAQPYLPETTDCGTDLLIFPNPVTTGKFTVQMDSASWRAECELVVFKIYLVSGRLLQQKKSHINDSFEVDVRHWPAGIYLLVFDYPKKRVVKKLVKI